MEGVVSIERTSLSGALGFQRATGINSVAGPGDRDGYRNLSGRLRGAWHPRDDIEIGASALALGGRSEFDGFDLFTGAHTDTLDSSRNHLTAGRLRAVIGTDDSPWRGQVAGSVLGSSNEISRAACCCPDGLRGRKTEFHHVKELFGIVSVRIHASICPEGHQDCLARVPPADVARAAAELIDDLDRDASPTWVDARKLWPSVSHHGG